MQWTDELHRTESRRILIIKEASLYNEKLARRLDQALPDIIDGEFSEAAE